MGKLSFGTTGISYQPDKVELKVGGAPKCPRCNDRVYFNEEKKALSKSWHSRCFSCANCKKALDSTNCSGHQGEIYCARCHRKEFGPKGYGFAGGMSGLSTESSYHSVRPVSPLHTQAVPEHIPSQTIQKDHPECCPRCGKRVYFAEEVKALQRKWHRLCFQCESCRTLMDTSRFNEHQSGVYCRSCYGRHFGPSGYGFAGGAGSIMSSELAKPYTQGSASKDVRSSINGSVEWTEDSPLRQNGYPAQGHFPITSQKGDMGASHQWTEGVQI